MSFTSLYSQLSYLKERELGAYPDASSSGEMVTQTRHINAGGALRPLK
jgi:hypothetical protein